VLGAWAYYIALGVFAFQEDGAFAVGLLGLVRWLTAAAVAPAAGVLGDRYSRKHVMIASDLSRAGVIALMAVGAVSGMPSLAIYALAVLGTVAATPFSPAANALLPDLAMSPQQLTAANATSSTIHSAGMFIGPAIGGLLMGATSAAVVFATTAALFVWSALNVARIGHHGRPEPRAADEDTHEGGRLREALAGFRELAAQPGLRMIVLLLAAETFVDGAVDVLLVVLALEILDIGASGVGLLSSVGGIGGLAAALLVGPMVARGRLATDQGLAVVLWGLPVILIGVWPEPALAFVAMTVVGAAGTITGVTSDTLFQRTAPRDVLARIFGVLNSILLVSVALGAVVAPILITTIGTRWALIAVGTLLPVLSLLSWGRLRALDVASALPDEHLVTLLVSSPIFAPLPGPTLELLVRSLEERQVPAGETVISQGERGDEFFVIEAGTAEAIVDGSPLRELGPGDSFGEIALLRETPRTATVLAKTDLVLQTLGRDDFLGAVTGHPESAAAAERVVGAHLGAPSPASL
jgi:MFS family permease